MNEENNIARNKAYDKLPVHRPDTDLWDRIGTKLDEQSAGTYRKAIAGLPVHKAPAGIWESIEKRLAQRKYRLVLAWLGIATAASLAIFAIIKIPFGTIPETGDKSTTITKAHVNPDATGSRKNIPVEAKSSQVPVVAISETQQKATDVHQKSEDKLRLSSINAAPITRTSIAELAIHQAIKINYISPLRQISAAKQPVTPGNADLVVIHSNIDNLNPENNSLPVQNRSKVALALAYIPESMNNGYNSILFHQVGLTASLDRNNFRFNSSFGMAYNSESYDYTVKFSQHLDGMGNSNDTTGAVYESVSQFEGTEKHGFVSWDIGAGHKLFTTRKLTTWINAGAGMAVRINNASLRDATVDAMKNSYNATVNSIDIEAPGYNRMSMSLVSGIEFDYRLLKRFSLTLQPQARYYFQSIFKESGNTPDPFSLGFRTGMKFDL